MPRFHRVRIVFVVCLIAALGALPVAAVPHEGSPARLAAPGVFSQIWSTATDLWEKVIAEAGCGIDPNGNCTWGQSAPARDAGCGIDPNGSGCDR